MRSEAVDGKYDGIMQKAKTYINDHFEKDGISLNMVAAEVNLSPSHFSTVFGQEMGETFVEYLTGMRIISATCSRRRRAAHRVSTAAEGKRGDGY